MLTSSTALSVSAEIADLRLPLYFDHHATTPVDPRVATVVVHHMTGAFGNASSRDHAYGDEADAAPVAAPQRARRRGFRPLAGARYFGADCLKNRHLV